MTPRAEEPKGRDRRPCLGMTQFLTPTIAPLGKAHHLIRSSAHIPHFTDEKTEASKGKVTETLLLRSHLRFRPPLKRTLTPEGAQAFQGLSHATAPPHHLSRSHLTLQARYTPQQAVVMQFSDRESQSPTPFHGQLPLCLLQEASPMPSTLVRCLL